MNRVIAISAASALQAAAYAAAGLVATRVLTPSDRGLMVLGITIGGISGLAGGLGSGAAFRAGLPNTRARRSLVCAFTWCSLGGVVLAVVTAVAGTAASAAWIDPGLRSPAFLCATAVCAAGQVLLTQVTDGWFADGRLRRGALAAAAMSLGGLTGVLAAAPGSPSAPVLLAAQGTGILAVGLFEVVGLRRAGLLRLSQPERGRIGELLRRGAPALGLTVGFAVVLRADRYCLGVVAGPAAVGIYSLAATLSEASRLLPAAAGQVYLRDTSVGLGASRLGGATRFAICAAAAGGMVVVVAGWALVVPVFGPEFAAALPLLPVLAVAEVCLAPFSVASRGLLGGGWTGAAGVLGGVTGGVALVGYSLAASVGPVGVAVGSVLLYAGMSVVAGDLLRRRVRATAHSGKD